MNRYLLKISLILTFLGLVVSEDARSQATLFNYTGNEQHYIVPNNVTSILIEAWGASGWSRANSGSSTANRGGFGAYVKGELSVTPGEVLYVYVGGQGLMATIPNTPMGGGWNGGGNGQTNDSINAAGGGGGSSDVRRGGQSLADRIIVAGGGGGATSNLNCFGGHGGAPDGLTGGGVYDAGTGGTLIAGGSQGGAIGQGGNATTSMTPWNGGGGGGYYGGGVSPANGPGGGGSSSDIGVVNSFMIAGSREGNGQVKITTKIQLKKDFSWLMFLPAITSGEYSPPPPIVPPPPPIPWQMFGRNQQHDNRSDYRGIQATSSNLKWYSSVSDLVQTSGYLALGKNNTLYTVGWGGSGYFQKYVLYAINGADGNIEWSYEARDLFDDPEHVTGTPAIGKNNDLFICDKNLGLHSVDTRTGSNNWKLAFANLKSDECPLTVAQSGDVFIAVEGLYFVDKVTGVVKWSYMPAWLNKPNDVKLCHLAPAQAADGTIYVAIENNGYDTGGIEALNQDGTLKWKYKTGGSPRTPPSISPDGTIYFGTSQSIYAVNPNGTLKWQVPRANPWASYDVDIFSIASDGTLYVFEDSAVTAYYPSDGSVKWLRDSIASTIVPFVTVDIDGTIYIGSENYLYALNQEDGSDKWKYHGSYVNFGPPIISTDGSLYLLTGSNIYAFRP